MDNLISQFNNIRAEEYSENRTLRSKELITAIEGIITKAENTYSWEIVSISLKETIGHQASGILCIRNTPYAYPQPDAIIAIIPFMNLPHSNFIQSLARSALEACFKKATFDTNGVKLIQSTLERFQMVQNDNDTTKRAQFTCIIGNFFDSHPLPPRNIPPPHIHLISSLLGMAVGDALGFLVEGQCKNVCSSYVDNVIRTGRAHIHGIHMNYGRFGASRYLPIGNRDVIINFGQYTDDTQFARELLLSIKDGGGIFNGQKYARRLVSMFNKSGVLHPNTVMVPVPGIVTKAIGYGSGTPKIVQEMANGVPWSLTGSVTTQGNGCCMRAGPLGALYKYKPHELVEVARQQALGTHASARCQATSVMIAEATRLSISDPWNVYDLENFPEIFCKRLSRTVRRVDIELSNAILEIPKYLESDTVESCIKKGKELGDGLWGNGSAISASAVQSSLYAVCCFLKHPNSYLDAICMSIRPGGDVDTIAAMCGAMVGARLGEKIYKELQVFSTCLNDQGEWRQHELAILCEEVFALVNS